MSSASIGWTSPRVTAIALSLALCTSRVGLAQAAPNDSSTAREIVPGVTLRRIVRAEGPVTMHVLEADLRRPEIVVRAVRACDRGTGRERPSAIVRRLRGEGIDVIAAINAGFFDLEGGTGTSESNVVVDGDIAKGVEITESPFDKFDNVHSQFGFTVGHRPVVDRFRLTGTVRTTRGQWELGAVNGAPVANKVALYTAWSDRAPPFPSRMRSAAAPLELVRGRGDGERLPATSSVLRYRVLAAAGRDTATDTTGTRALLVGVGSAADGVARLKPGDVVTVTTRFSPDRGPLRTLVGGWPRVVRGGVDVAAAADSVEGTFPRFAAGRNPRSAVGFSRDSATLFLVAVDGRQTGSMGMTLVELAKAMIGLGVYDALNLDGGGSTALVVGDTVVNKPSDQTGERPVGDVLVITRELPDGVASARRHVPTRATLASCVKSGNRDPDRVAQPTARPAPPAPD
jgi:phosphodiester glycosidase